ncbi:hypothetical protein TUA1478L_17940 [Lactiplantibacillus plantarum]
MTLQAQLMQQLTAAEPEMIKIRRHLHAHPRFHFMKNKPQLTSKRSIVNWASQPLLMVMGTASSSTSIAVTLDLS